MLALSSCCIGLISCPWLIPGCCRPDEAARVRSQGAQVMTMAQLEMGVVSCRLLYDTDTPMRDEACHESHMP